MSSNYPKILSVGQYFTTQSGGGITMTNLFKGWNKENIAVVAENINNPNFDVCNKYYQLGSLEIKRKFPFNLNRWSKPIKSGLIDKKDMTSILSSTNETKKSKFKDIYLRFLHLTGLYHYKRRYRISENLLRWIKEYSPDIIYSQLSTIELIRFVGDLQNKLKLPIAIHMMDDWPVTISKKGLFQSYWHKTIDKGFRQLLGKAKVLMSISESMSNEYLSRYGYHFIPFHNPIDIAFWGQYSKKNYDIKDDFTIFYAGRIGTGIQNCFLDIADAVSNLISKGLKIKFHIQATNFNPVLDDLAKFDFIRLNKAVAYNELPNIFAKSDLLLLPNDFDDKSVSYLKYSMPTKASEYMISGSPILLYSSIETAVTKHALKYHWAYVVSEKSKEKLEFAIGEIYKKKDLRIKLGNTAREYAINQYDDKIIKDQFRKSFI